MKLLLAVATIIAATYMADAASVIAAKPASRQSPGKQEESITACECTKIWLPVCGEDGQTYGNECEAKCRYVGIAHAGECPATGCLPTLEYNPVCGVDGKPYSNPSSAYCAGVEIAHEGVCLVASG